MELEELDGAVRSYCDQLRVVRNRDSVGCEVREVVVEVVQLLLGERDQRKEL